MVIRAVLLAAAGLMAAAPIALAAAPLETPAGRKPRVVITADPELDDSNSLVRYLLFSPDFQTEGLIYASSQFHWKGDGKGTKLIGAGPRVHAVRAQSVPVHIVALGSQGAVHR